jgi:hypothetical protein
MPHQVTNALDDSSYQMLGYALVGMLEPQLGGHLRSLGASGNVITLFFLLPALTFVVTIAALRPKLKDLGLKTVGSCAGVCAPVAVEGR